MEASSSGSGRPSRVYMARVKGLPATTVAVFGDRVVVKHPLHQSRQLAFNNLAKAKRWLQSLTKRGGQPSTLSDYCDVDDARYPSTSYTSPMLGNASGSESEDIEEDSPKPKRFKRSSTGRKSKSAMSIAAEMSNMSAISQPAMMPVNKRSATQRQLHIRKEQQRREEQGRLVRELNQLIAPEGYIRSKVLVIKQVSKFIHVLQ